MNTAELSPTDVLVRLSRRSLWTALVLIAAIGVTAIVQLLAPGSAAARTLACMLPVVIVIAAVSLRVAPPTDAAAMHVVLGDELRQAALARAYRNAFLAMLALQPLAAVGLTASAPANALPLLTVATVLTGTLACIASVLYADR